MQANVVEIMQAINSVII